MPEFFVSYDLKEASSERYAVLAGIIGGLLEGDEVASTTWKLNWPETKEALAKKVGEYMRSGDTLVVIESSGHLRRQF